MNESTDEEELTKPKKKRKEKMERKKRQKKAKIKDGQNVDANADD